MDLGADVFTEEWADDVFDTWKVFTNATIEIYTETEQTYDFETNTYSGGEKSHWEGPARLKDIRSAERDFIAGNDGKTQYFRVQIPRNSLEIRDTMRVRVLDGGLVEDMVNWDFYVTDYYNQSGAFEQTFIVTTNSGRP